MKEGGREGGREGRREGFIGLLTLVLECSLFGGKDGRRKGGGKEWRMCAAPLR